MDTDRATPMWTYPVRYAAFGGVALRTSALVRAHRAPRTSTSTLAAIWLAGVDRGCFARWVVLLVGGGG